jgi:hypothetical protein
MRDALSDTFQTIEPRLNGVITAVPISSTTARSLGYVVAKVAGNAGVRVAINPDGPLPAIGDSIIARQSGSPLNATYTIDGYTGITRPSSVITQFMDPATVGDTVYGGGDILIGDAKGGPNTWIEAGATHLRNGSTDLILLDSTGAAPFVRIGEEGVGKSNVYIDPDKVALRVGTTEKVTLGSDGNVALTGDMVVGTSGVIRSGATGFMTGVGYWMDYNNGAPRIRIGDPNGHYIVLDGSDLTVNVAADHGALGGLGDDDHPQYGAIAQNETVSGSWTHSNLAVTDWMSVGGNLTVGNGADVDVQFVLHRTTGGDFILQWNGVLATTTKSFKPSDLGLARISQSAPTTPFAGMVWLDPTT